MFIKKCLCEQRELLHEIYEFQNGKQLWKYNMERLKKKHRVIMLNKSSIYVNQNQSLELHIYNSIHLFKDIYPHTSIIAYKDIERS